MRFFSKTSRCLYPLLAAPFGLVATTLSLFLACPVVCDEMRFDKRFMAQPTAVRENQRPELLALAALAVNQAKPEKPSTNVRPETSPAADQSPVERHRFRHFLAQILESTTAHILAAAVIALGGWILARRRLFGTTLARYRRDLQEQMSMMPFIYGDLRGEVLNDFVQVEIYVLDETSRIRKTGQRGHLRDDERLRLSRRIIFLAGC
jgi:hypothetical protein